MLYAQPIIDTLTLSVRYNASFAGMRNKDVYLEWLERQFKSFCRVIERYTGKKVEYAWRDETYFVPGYGIFLTYPDAKFGYGRVYFQPAAERLELVQKWLKACFGPAYVHCVHLQNIELAYDFYCENLLFSDYESLVPRVAARIVQKNAINSFVVALRGKRKRCGDGAVNGEFTCYVQSCDKHGASNLSSDLDYKRKVAGKTIIYAKSIKDRSFLRIEIKMDDGKAKRCGIIFDPKNMCKLMNLPKLPFSKFWQFKEVDVEQFIESLGSTQGLKNIRHGLWAKRLHEVIHAPVADKIRLMKIACKCSKQLKNTMKKCVKTMNFDDVVNLPLPNGFFIAWRKGSGPLPDDGELPEKVVLVPFRHDPLPALPLKPMQEKLPIAADMAQNRAKLAPTGPQSQNPVVIMAQPMKAPIEAQDAHEVEMKRTRWPKQERPEDGIFRLVELPDGMSITQAQIGQNPTYKPVLDTQSKNPGKPMAKHKPAPHKARGDGPGP